MRVPISLALFLASAPLFGQFKLESAGPPPVDVPASFAELLAKEGIKVTAASGAPACELWFRTSAPTGGKSTEEGVVFPTIPHGALMGVIRFSGRGGADRRGQNIKAGVYTLRYSQYPVNGDHQGVAPQRDFLVLSPIGEDKDPASTPKFEDLMNMSRKASGAPHPAVLSISKSGGGATELKHEGENDWVLNVKVGDLPLAVIVIGRAEG
jgi:hypothetical protein